MEENGLSPRVFSIARLSESVRVTLASFDVSLLWAGNVAARNYPVTVGSATDSAPRVCPRFRSITFIDNLFVELSSAIQR
jgi:hypothetical protein